jgi:replication initiation and membrane attachment protein DnaB
MVELCCYTIFGVPTKKKGNRENTKKKKKNYSKKTKKYISGKRIPKCLENSQRLVEEDKKNTKIEIEQHIFD